MYLRNHSSQFLYNSTLSIVGHPIVTVGKLVISAVSSTLTGTEIVSAPGYQAITTWVKADEQDTNVVKLSLDLVQLM